MTVTRPAALLISFCAIAAACSDSGSHTILLTNALGFDYTVIALDNGDTATRDTILIVPNGSQVCWRLSSAKPTPFTMELDSYNTTMGFIIASTTVEPRSESWTWDGAGPNARVGPAC
jgi:hypothetical protein